MRFGRCANCNEYKYLKKDGKCPTCLEYKIDVYEIKGSSVEKALKIIKEEKDGSNLPASPNPSYSNIVEELLDTGDIGTYGVNVTEGVYNQIKNIVEDYKKNNSGNPTINAAFQNLKNTDPTYKLSTDKAISS